MDLSKEHMLLSMKMLQEKADTLEKLLEKGNNVIVLQFSSSVIRYGFASEQTPFKIRNIIAKKQKTINPQQTNQISKNFEKHYNDLESELKKSNLIKCDKKKKVKVEFDIREECYLDLVNCKDEFFDEEAIEIANKYHKEYELFYPMRFGLLNTSQSLSKCIDCLTRILKHGLLRDMGLKDFSKLSFVLIISPFIIEKHVKAILTMLYKDFRFENGYIHLEQVAATFGNNMSSGCIVHIGQESIVVGCVDEGVFLPGSLVYKPFGLNLISDLFLRNQLLYSNTIRTKQQEQWKKKEYSEEFENQIKKSLFFEKIKEKGFIFAQEEEQQTKVFYGNYWENGVLQDICWTENEAFTVASNFLFSQRLLLSKMREEEFDILKNIVKDKDLPNLEEYYQELLEQSTDITLDFKSENKVQRFGILKDLEPEMENIYKVQDLATIICYSICSQLDEELRKKLANNILVSTCFSQTPFITQEIEERTIDRLNAFDPSIDRIEVILPKCESGDSAWIGGSIIAKLESVDESWISRQRFLGGPQMKRQLVKEEEGIKVFVEQGEDFGMRAFKERMPFEWQLISQLFVMKSLMEITNKKFSHFGKHAFLKDLGLAPQIQGSFVKGKWSGSGQIFKSYDTTTRELIAEVQGSTLNEYKDAVEDSKQAFLQWNQIPMPKRGEIIKEIGEEFKGKKKALGQLISLEMGKIVSEGEGEVQETVDICDFACGLSRTLSGKVIPTERPDHFMLENWNPLGPIGVITAFNFPNAVLGWNAAIAMVCGNTIVWKGAPSTPLVSVATTKIITDVLQRHGMPSGVFSNIIGGTDIGQALCEDPDIKLVSFTGSTKVGKIVQQKVNDRFGKVLLELGGNNAAIIMEDADINNVVKACTFAAVGTSGQRCTTLRRMIIHSAIYEEVKEKIIKAYNSIKIGNPLETGILCGPLHNEVGIKHYMQAIEDIKEQGGKILRGGNLINDKGDGYFVEPTIVEIDSECKIVKSEVFAPILYLHKFSTLEEAITINNNVPQGLSSSMFSKNVQNLFKWIGPNGSDCGIINFNIGPSGAEIGGAFGGEKESGGGRESGSDAWKQYMRRSTCTISYGDKLTLAQGVKFDLD